MDEIVYTTIVFFQIILFYIIYFSDPEFSRLQISHNKVEFYEINNYDIFCLLLLVVKQGWKDCGDLSLWNILTDNVLFCVKLQPI